jgi:nitroreductase
MCLAAISISAVLQQRRSVRAFKDAPVPQEVLEEIFTLAQHAPSNCNVQPCQTYVVSGAKKDQLKEELVNAVLSGRPPNPDFEWDVRYQGEHRERQFGSANALYGAMGIDRKDKERRQVAMLRNWQFFGAPHAAFFTMEKYLKMTGAVDLGVYAQTLALLMVERGISSCMQGALGMFPDPARRMFGLPDEVGILFGMSFGYADDAAPANKARTERVPLETMVRFFG